NPEQLSALFEGEDLGTLFLAQEQQRTSRKHWIAHTVKAKGQLVLDDGAVEALMRRGKSLLPSGVIAVRGTFEAGDSVACVDHADREIAKGLVNYSSQAITRIMGQKSTDIQKTLGYKDYDEVIHRDNLVIM
ncbi:MAG TPA: PUA domain-containing protein, partial [Nitrospirales bacterium]